MLCNWYIRSNYTIEMVFAQCRAVAGDGVTALVDLVAFRLINRAGVAVRRFSALSAIGL
ncbi:hypothetical protein HC928_25550 [bacterium]|nr:hypothetical protein [bacterium]